MRHCCFVADVALRSPIIKKKRRKSQKKSRAPWTNGFTCAFWQEDFGLCLPEPPASYA